MSQEQNLRLTGCQIPPNPIAPCRWDFGLRGTTDEDKILLFTLDNTVEGTIYPMLLQDAGSVKIELPEGRLIVYQHLLHLLKALSNCKISVPKSVATLIRKFDALKKLVLDLKSIDNSAVSEIRVELSAEGNYSFLDATQLAERYVPLDRLPDGILVGKMITFDRYLGRLDTLIEKIDRQRIFREGQQPHHTHPEALLGQIVQQFGLQHG